jgi:hypothetical protein
MSDTEMSDTGVHPLPADPPTEEMVAPPPDIHPDDPDDEWPQEPPRRSVRLHAATAALLVLLLLAGGFWGGAVAEKHHSGSSSTSSALSALANRFAAARGGSGLGLGRAAAGAATTGIVSGVKGSTLYVTDASGNLIAVQIGPSTTITRTARTSLAGIQPGDTVIVSGTAGAHGTVAATAVRATGPGVGGGLGSFLGGGAGGG